MAVSVALFLTTAAAGATGSILRGLVLTGIELGLFPPPDAEDDADDDPPRFALGGVVVCCCCCNKDGVWETRVLRGLGILSLPWASAT